MRSDVQAEGELLALFPPEFVRDEIEKRSMKSGTIFAITRRLETLKRQPRSQCAPFQIFRLPVL